MAPASANPSWLRLPCRASPRRSAQTGRVVLSVPPSLRGSWFALFPPFAPGLVDPETQRVDLVRRDHALCPYRWLIRRSAAYDPGS